MRISHKDGQGFKHVQEKLCLKYNKSPPMNHVTLLEQIGRTFTRAIA